MPVHVCCSHQFDLLRMFLPPPKPAKGWSQSIFRNCRKVKRVAFDERVVLHRVEGDVWGRMYPFGGVRPFHQKSTCITQVTVGLLQAAALPKRPRVEHPCARGPQPVRFPERNGGEAQDANGRSAASGMVIPKPQTPNRTPQCPTHKP